MSELNTGARFGPDFDGRWRRGALRVARLAHRCALSVLSIVLLLALPIGLLAQTLDQGIQLKKAQRLAEAAEVFRAIVAREPHHSEALSQLATVEAWLQKYDSSIANWKQAIRLEPDNAEFHTGLARVLFWRGDTARAQTELHTALKISPNDSDALLLMGDLQLQRGETREARASYLSAQKNNPDSPELKRKLLGLVESPRWRVDLGYASDNYDNLRGHEAGTVEQIGYRLDHRTDVWVQHQYLRHFGFVDNTVEFGTAHTFSKSFVADANVAFTPHNNFEPDWRTHLGADYQMRSWIGFTGNLKVAAYATGLVITYMPGAHVRVRPWAVFSFQDGISHNLDQTITTSWVARGDFQLRESLALYGGYARGVEDIPPQRSAFNETYFTGVFWSASRHWGLRLDGAYENRPTFYRRLSVNPGISYHF